jgi:hypothetical protein
VLSECVYLLQGEKKRILLCYFDTPGLDPAPSKGNPRQCPAALHDGQVGDSENRRNKGASSSLSDFGLFADELLCNSSNLSDLVAPARSLRSLSGKKFTFQVNFLLSPTNS